MSKLAGQVLEKWRDVIGFEGYYRISNLGRVYGVLKNKILRPATDKLGYKYIQLFKDTVPSTQKVHRLVAAAFLIRKEGEVHVNHIDKNPSNNCFNNLQWVSIRENNIHSLGITSSDPVPVSKFYDKLRIRATKGHLVKDFESPHEAMSHFDVSKEDFDDFLFRGFRCKQYHLKII